MSDAHCDVMKARRDEALMIVTRNGRIAFATAHARRWLTEHLRVRAGAVDLPAVLLDWMRASGRNRGRCRPWVIESPNTQIVISLLHPEADGAYSLLVQRRRSGTSSVRTRHLGLTKRQAEVHALLKRGKTNGEIAQTLGIGEATVKRHVEDVLARLHVRNRAAAAAV